MRRPIFHTTAALSLLACIACLTLYVLSHTRLLMLNWAFRPSPTELRERYLISAHGRLYLRARLLENPAMARPPYQARPLSASTSSLGPWSSYAAEWDRIPRQRCLPGVRFGRRTVVTSYSYAPAYSESYHQLLIPWLYPASLFAILPAAWLRSHLRRTLRKRRGLCLSCGYDLRASPTRCPECGASTTSSFDVHVECSTFFRNCNLKSDFSLPPHPPPPLR